MKYTLDFNTILCKVKGGGGGGGGGGVDIKMEHQIWQLLHE